MSTVHHAELYLTPARIAALVCSRTIHDYFLLGSDSNIVFRQPLNDAADRTWDHIVGRPQEYIGIVGRHFTRGTFGFALLEFTDEKLQELPAYVHVRGHRQPCNECTSGGGLALSFACEDVEESL